MKRSDDLSRTRGLIIIGIVLIAFVSLPFFVFARTAVTSVRIVNNSNREIRNVYSSHVGSDDWSADLLGEGSIAAGQSQTLPNVACDGEQVKVIAEDQDGCFLTTVADCGSSPTWTITDSTSRDCGY